MATFSHSAFAVKPYVNPETGTQSWRVTGTGVKNGRIRKNFADRAEAEQFCNQKNVEELGMPAASQQVHYVQTRLAVADVHATEAALFRANGRWPLPIILSAGIEALESQKPGQALTELAAQWLALIQNEVAPTWHSDLTDRINRFLRDHPGMTSAQIDNSVARKWIDGLELHPTTKRNFRGALHRWGGWLKARGYVELNPFSDIRILAPKGGIYRTTQPTVLDPMQCEALLRGCMTPRCRRWLGACVLSMFGGLRPLAEVPRRLWSEVNFKTGEISVIGTKRGGTVRIFKAHPLLLKWLNVVQADGAEKPGIWSIKLRIAATEWANGWLSARGHTAIEWDGDILRHTFASYRAHEMQIDDLAKMMGTSKSMIYAHYRHPRTEAQAKAFWKLTPAAILASP